WPTLPRAQLVLASLKHPDLIDARFHNVVQCDKQIPSLLKSQGLVSSSVSRPDHIKYKYLVDVDGNSCSYERYFWLLLSNSVVLKQQTPNIQWYYRALQPYKHYIPVKEDLSDLTTQINWAKEHDEECRQMAQAATAFVEDNLSPEDTLVYLHHLICSYSKLLIDK